MIRPLVIGFFAAILFVGIATYLHLKAYKEPSIFYDNRPDFYIIYIEVKGDYIQTSTKIAEVESLLASNGISCKDTFGLFFDNPAEVVAQDLKSWVGCIFLSLPSTIPSSIEAKKLLAEKNILNASYEGSPALGPRKVYPKAEKVLGTKSLFPALEIYSYDTNKELTTHYYFLISPQTIIGISPSNL